MNPIKTIKKTMLAAILLLAAAISLGAQDKPTQYKGDFQGRGGVSFKFKLCKGLTFSIADEVRIKDDFGAFERNHLTGSFSYKVCDYFSLGAGYVFIAKFYPDNADRWIYNHRVQFDATGKYKAGNWSFSLRERPMLTLTPVPGAAPKQNWLLRHQLNIKYAIPKTPMTPYVFFEPFNTLNAPKEVGPYLERMRFAVGITFKIDKMNAIDLYYFYDLRNKKAVKNSAFSWTRSDVHIIGLAYKFAM